MFLVWKVFPKNQTLLLGWPFTDNISQFQYKNRKS